MGWISNFTEWYNAWANIDLVKETIPIATANEREIADLNRQQLYEKGEKADGTKLKKYKNPKYARAKHEMNPKPGLGNPDFRVTGAFHESIFVDARDNGSLIFDAADRKVEFLVERDGESIFGLQPDNQKKVWQDILRPPLIQQIALKTGAKIK